MSYGTASKKFSEGKFVKVELNYTETITDILISGDFFLVPEDLIDTLQKELCGMSDESDFKLAINTIIMDNDAQLIGCTPNQLAELIVEAIGNGLSNSRSIGD